jgi:hypothetical protein
VEAEWSMAGANVQRTGYVTEEITGNMNPRWYRPIEPYISQNVQLIAWDGKIYVTTARGCTAFSRRNGDLLWVYPTELPLGHSPAIVDGVVYVAGFDQVPVRHQRDDGRRAVEMGWGTAWGSIRRRWWSTARFISATATGICTASGRSATRNEGQLVWSFPTGGPINYSAAYYNGRVYFASMDLHCYAVDAETGAQVWKSPKYQYTCGFQSIWPVVWAAKNKVVFCMNTPNYGNAYNGIEHAAIYGALPNGLHRCLRARPSCGRLGGRDNLRGYGTAGGVSPDLSVAENGLVLDADTGAEYTWLHEGSRRTRRSDGWAPSSSRRETRLPLARTMCCTRRLTGASPIPSAGGSRGWTLGSRWLSLPNPNKHNAWDEPLAFALGRQRDLLVDLLRPRGGHLQAERDAGNWQFVSYNLPSRVPGYDVMWFA